MTIALEIGVACVLTVALLAITMVLSAFQLGRLVTRDDNQRDLVGDARRVQSVQSVGTRR
jgi:hypothetical protein